MPIIRVTRENIRSKSVHSHHCSLLERGGSGDGRDLGGLFCDRNTFPHHLL